MKKLITTFSFMICAITMMAQAPAFPGAEGVARYTTTGGRGGQVIHVTNLNDSGPGSLRAACTASGARIVVFDVSGTITLKSALKINKDDITILGQTAPGDGICLRGYTFNISANNVIVRFIRCRLGDETKTNDDAMNAYFKSGSEKKNIIIDHCTMSWSTDECGSFYGIENFTLQWCMLSESLANSIHEKGSHGYGGIWGGKNAAYHHNLLASHTSRNPRFDHDYVNTLKGPIDYINNVVYNWGGNSTYGGESANTNNEFKMYNIINNYYKAGSTSSNKYRIVNPTTKCSNCTNKMGCNTIVPGHFYVTGNYMYGSTTVTNDNWQGVQPDDSSVKNSIKSATRFVAENSDQLTTMHKAEVAFEKVLNYVGASYRRDTIDRRIVKETRNGSYTFKGSNGSTGGFIDTQNDVGGWPTLEQYDNLEDSDNDGMPDIWETANGLNANDASDATTITLDKKGYYTNIEVYANALVEDMVKAQNADAQFSVEEYYPEIQKAKGVHYYDGTPGRAGYGGSSQDSEKPSSESATYTVSFNGEDLVIPGGFFSFGDGKHNFNNKFTGSYDGMEFTSGLKMEGTTLVEFTTPATATVTIVQSTWSDYTLKFDGAELDVTSAATPTGSTGVRVYTINGIGADTHKITRGSGESGIFYVEVKTEGATGITNNKYSQTGKSVMHNLAGQRVSGNFKGLVIRDGRKYTSK